MKHFNFEEIFHPEKPEIVKIAFHVRNDSKYEGEKGAWALLQEDMMKEQRCAQKTDDKKVDRWQEMNLSCFSKSDPPVLHLIVFAQYLDYGTDYFIFGGYYVYNGDEKTLERDKGYDEYRGRLVIKRKGNYGRGHYFNYNTVKNKKDGEEAVGFPEIYALLPLDKGVGPFLGYDKVLLTHKQLSRIVNNNAADWMSALSKIKAVYCITDTSTGKLYVGSANSKNDGYTKENAEKDAGSSKGLWGRWQYYAGEKSKGNKAEKDEEKNLTGDDKFFEDLIKTTDGKEYIKNYFTYTILEIFDIRTADIVVRERERFWKKALHTLYPYGMNYNL